MSVNDRTEICKFTCALKNMSWSDRSQDFSWTSEESENDSATPTEPGTLARQVYVQDDITRRKKSAKNLERQQSLAVEEPNPDEPLPLPKNFTIHVRKFQLIKQNSNLKKKTNSIYSCAKIGFGLRRFPDFDPIEISPPVKSKIKVILYVIEHDHVGNFSKRRLNYLQPHVMLIVDAQNVSLQ